MNRSPVLLSLQEIFFPRACLLCHALLTGGGEGPFCSTCYHMFHPLVAPLCTVCGMPLAADDGVCEKCLRSPPPYTFCHSLFAYNEVMRRFVLQFKFRYDRLVLSGIARLCRDIDLTPFAEVDLVAPVPLHPLRLRKRGFNQSLLLCTLFFGGNKDVKIVPKLLERTKNTVPQSSLKRKERLINLQKMFRCCDNNLLSGKRVCLVDDVITTGATVRECCDILLKSGCYSVCVLSLARTLPKSDMGSSRE